MTTSLEPLVAAQVAKDWFFSLPKPNIYSCRKAAVKLHACCIHSAKSPFINVMEML